MLNSFVKKLQEPFPERQHGLTKVKEVFFTAMFVAIFLYLFNPFGLQNMPQGLGLSAFIFGVITFVFYLFFHIVVKNVLKIHSDVPSWTLWKWIISMMLMTLWISVGNFVFLIYSLPDNFKLSDFPKMLQYTLMVGITPMAVSGMLIQMNALKRHVSEAKNFEKVNQQALQNKQCDQSHVFELEISNGEKLLLSAESIYFIEAMQNYLMVHHSIAEATKIKQTIVRLTMTKAQTLLKDDNVIRCHRSFIVNTQKVEKVTGNAQGLKLKLIDLNEREIPVSRRYIPQIKDALLAAR